MDGLPAIQLTSLNVRSWPILLKNSVLKRAAISFAFQAPFCTVDMRSLLEINENSPARRSEARMQR